MLSWADKAIYAAYAVVVAFFMALISRNRLAEDTELEKDPAFVRLSGTAAVSECLLVLTVVVFCAFRCIGEGVGGTDANAYRLQFLSSTGTLLEQLVRFKGWEPLHAVSLWVVRQFTEEYRVYLVLYYIALSLLLIRLAKMYEFREGSFLTLFALALFSLNSFNTQRNTFAAFLGFIIVGYLRRQKYKSAVLVALITTLIHFSAAIYFLAIAGFYFLRYVYGKYERKLVGYVLFSMAAAAGISLLIPLIVGNSRLSVYKASASLSVPTLAAFLFLAAFQYIYRDRLREDEDTAVLSAVALTFAPMFVFQLFYSIMYRMMLFFIPVMYVLIWKYKCLDKEEQTMLGYGFYVMLDAILLLRVLPFFLAAHSDIGSYASTLF